jgi:hypothetical protein
VFVDSMNAGIGVLLIVTAVVLAAFVRFFLSLARRSRDSAHLVETRGFAEPPLGPAPFSGTVFEK